MAHITRMQCIYLSQRLRGKEFYRLTKQDALSDIDLDSFSLSDRPEVISSFSLGYGVRNLGAGGGGVRRGAGGEKIILREIWRRRRRRQPSPLSGVFRQKSIRSLSVGKIRFFSCKPFQMYCISSCSKNVPTSSQQSLSNWKYNT